MIDDYKLKTFIENSVKIISERLNLTTPRIGFSEYWGIGYMGYTKTINISLEELKKECKKWDKNLCPLKITNYLNKVYFVIAHEVAHLLQHTKFPEWFQKYEEQKHNTGWKTNKDYAQIKLEKNATKIAYILYKEYKIRKLNE